MFVCTISSVWSVCWLSDTLTSHVLKPELNSAYSILFSETSLSDNSHAGYGVLSGRAGGRHGEGAVGEVEYLSNNSNLTILYAVFGTNNDELTYEPLKAIVILTVTTTSKVWDKATKKPS